MKINTVFRTKKFQKRREKIFQKNNKLIKKVSEQEIKDTITQLNNGTACGPDNISNEMIKHMAKSQKFVILLTKLITFALNKKISLKCGKNLVYILFIKKEIQIIP